MNYNDNDYILSIDIASSFDSDLTSITILKNKKQLAYSVWGNGEWVSGDWVKKENKFEKRNRIISKLLS